MIPGTRSTIPKPKVKLCLQPSKKINFRILGGHGWRASVYKATLGRSSPELVQESGPTEGQIPVLRKMFHIPLAAILFDGE